MSTDAFRWFVLAVILLPAIGVMWWVLVDIVRHGKRIAGRVVWITIVLVFPGLGALIYLLTRPHVDGPAAGFGPSPAPSQDGFFVRLLRLGERRLAGELTLEEFRTERARLQPPP